MRGQNTTQARSQLRSPSPLIFDIEEEQMGRVKHKRSKSGMKTMKSSESFMTADQEVAMIGCKADFSLDQINVDLAMADKASKDMLNATYQNVLPSKIRTGNMNVMPLLPKDIDKIPIAGDQTRLKQVIQQSAYVLAMYQERN